MDQRDPIVSPSLSYFVLWCLKDGPSSLQDTNINFPKEKKQNTVFSNTKWIKFNNANIQKTNIEPSFVNWEEQKKGVYY